MSSTRLAVDRLIAASGAISGMWALGLLVWARENAAPSALYVSELGAAGEPTAGVFRGALLSLAVSGVLVAIAHRRSVRTPSVVARLLPTVLGVASACFVVAATVPCSPTCPMPDESGFASQDAVHITAAVTGFAASCVAMLCAAATPGPASRATVSLFTASFIAIVATTGALLSVFDADLRVGGTLEFVAAVTAIGWLAGYALAVAVATRSMTRLAKPMST